MTLQRQPVGHAVSVRTAGGGLPIIEVFYAVVLADRASGKGIIRQARLQQITGDVKRHGGSDTTAHRIGGGDHRVTRAVNKRHIGHRPGAWLHVCLAGTIAVDKEIDGGGNGCLAGKSGQRIGYQIGTDAEVAADADAAKPHAAAPRQRVGDQIANPPAYRCIFIFITPPAVVADVAIVLISLTAFQLLLPDTVSGDVSGITKHPQFMSGGKAGAAVIGAAGIKIVVNQCTAAGAAWITRSVLCLTNDLTGQPVRRHGQQQALPRSVILHADGWQAADINLWLLAQLSRWQTGTLQIAAAQPEMTVALLHRHNVAVRLLVNHQLQHITLTATAALQAGRRGQG